ncbi:MAG: DUF5060 domain-containing protein, partial [Phycisphaerae bacterium]|nr:DUF5060 domain-containing protein [Phycisphaerae bacterium]
MSSMTARCIAAVCVLAVVAPLSADSAKQIAPATFGDNTATLWSPTLEWTLKNASHEGNPFDLVAKATFTHASGKEQRVTEMFYAGDDTWKFRFTGTRTGEWTFTTQADGADGTTKDPELDGKRGAVTVRPNRDADAYGFVTNLGNRWARHQGNDGAVVAFVPHFRMGFEKRSFNWSAAEINRNLDVWLGREGFNGVFVFMAGYWVDRDGGSKFHKRDPDLRSFGVLEDMIAGTYARDGVVHLWYCGDSGRRQSARRAFGKAGAATKEERCLLRYIGARLGPLPGWIMGYGYDNPEHVNTAELRGWGSYLRKHMAYRHMLGARDQGGNINYTYWPEADFYSRGHWFRGASYGDLVKAMKAETDKPHTFDERWWIKRLGSEDKLRRQLWLCNMGGGVSAIFGNKGDWSRDPYSHPEYFKTFFAFWQDRFAHTLSPQKGSSGTYCLMSSDKSCGVFYAESAESVAMDLSGMSGPQPAVAVDTKKAYREIDIGPLTPGEHTWKAPYKSDWAVAVGTFP